MTEDKFDVIVIGAGPAGTSAAITAARAGLSCVVLERGEYPGAKNVQGGILYTKMLDDIVPGFWKDDPTPVDRHITEQKILLLSRDSGIQMGFKSSKWNKEPHNCYSIIRVNFDRWYAKKAEEAGAEIYTGVLVSDLIKKDGKVSGVKTSEGDELFADCIIAADGVNSVIAQKAGLIDEWKPEEVALGVKETLGLPKEKIEDRFGLEGNEGTTFEIFGDITGGMLGYGFLYTNKETISIGLGCKLSHFQKTGIPPYELLEALKAHPNIRRLIQGAQALEYSGHLIPEGGYNSMPPVFTDGLMIAGDAAQMGNPSHREGSNFAMTAGKLAAETAAEAKKKGDFSAKTLSLYKEKLQNAYIMDDMFDIKDLENEVEKRPQLLKDFPDLACDMAYEYFNVDGRKKRELFMSLMDKAFSNKGVRSLVRQEMNLKNAFLALKYGPQIALKYFMTKEK